MQAYAKPPLPRPKSLLTTTGCEPSCFSVNPSLRCLPEHNLSFISWQKTNIKCRAFCFTSATVYLPGSRLLLFLHVPDIIIAVQGMIICLLWKLADCLSPVPEELPLKGIPLEKHHKSGFSSAHTHKGADRTTQDGEEGTATEWGREKVAVPLCYKIYLNWSIHHTCFSASSLEWNG